MNLTKPDLKEISLDELRVLLENEVKSMRTAHRKFQIRKMELTLNYKKIDVRQIAIDDSTPFDISLMEKKEALWRKIQKVRQHTEIIESMTQQLGNLSFGQFSTNYFGALTTSRIVEILKNLHATEEEIEDMLLILRGDEDYDEVRDRYSDYYINKKIESGEISGEFADDDDVDENLLFSLI